MGLLLGLSLGTAIAEGTKMDDKAIQQKIAEAVHTEYGWELGEVRVDEVERLRQASCSFYTTASTQRPLSYQPNYAVLPGNQVIGLGTEGAAGKILDACSAGASADWWAEIVTRFHPDLGGGIVLSDRETRPDIVRKLTQAGQAFTPPAFGADRKSVSFLLLNPETYVLYRVEANRTSGGTIQVVKTKLLGKSSGSQTNSQVLQAGTIVT